MSVHARLHRESDLPQQVHGLLVAGVERPVREADQVGEQDGHLPLAAAAALGLGERLPHLERAEAELADRARPLVRQVHDALPEELRRLVAGHRQRVAVALVARQQAARRLGGLDQARVRVEALERLGEPPPLTAVGLRHAGHSGSVAPRGTVRD